MPATVRVRADRVALKRLIQAALLAAVIGMGMVVYFVTRTPRVAELPPPPAEPPPPVQEPTPEFVTGDNMVPIQVFLPDSGGGGLVQSEREIFGTRGLASQAKQALTLLLTPDDPSLALFPEGTRIRELFVDPHGEVFIDFSAEVQAPSGIEEEFRGLAALALTLSTNFPEIERLRILVEGREATTLRGHLSIEYPLLARHPSYDAQLVGQAD